MRKLLSVTLALGLLLGVVGLAQAESPESQNVFDLHKFGGEAGVTPPTVYVKVRYGVIPPIYHLGSAADLNIASGEVVVWDTNSADGYTISACIQTDYNALSYAGVMITAVTTAEDAVVRGSGTNVGYMAIGGYCLAQVDTSEAVTGGGLVPTGSNRIGSFGTKGEVTMPTEPYGDATHTISFDAVGVLLTDTTSDGLMPVYLR